MQKTTRRDFIRKAGLLAATAMAVPSAVLDGKTTRARTAESLIPREDSHDAGKGRLTLEWKDFTGVMKHTFTISGSSRNSTPIVITRITWNGYTGYGEASMPPYLGESQASVHEFLKKVRDEILPRFDDPFRIQEIMEETDRLAANNTAAKASVDIALHDLTGRIMGQPWWKIWGFSPEKTPCTSFTIGYDDDDEVVREKTDEASWAKILKVKLGMGEEADKRMIRLIRSINRDTPICIDANQGWHGKEAVELLSRLNEYDIELVEQPVPRYDFEGLKYVTTHSPVPVMADESCWDSKDALKLVSERAVDYINIKLMKCGGLYEAKKIVNIAEAAGVECMLGCMAEESGIAVNAAAALGAALKNITRADLDAAFTLSELPYEGGFTVVDTRKLVLPDAAGLGISGLKEAMLG